MVRLQSKLPHIGKTIFTVMSQLAREHDAINLSQGFPDFDCPQELKDRVNFHLQGGKNQYAPGNGVPILTQRIAHKIEKAHNLKIDPVSQVTVVAGASQGIFTSILAYVHPGDEVIIFEPAYDCYAPAIELTGARVVPYTLHGPDYKIDWNRVKSMITQKTRMILINTPHNPTGQVLAREDMEALEAITTGSDIIVMSDEVYEHLIYDDLQHESILRYPNLFERSIAIYSFGKTFHNTGWKVGYCVAPPALMNEFRKVHQFNVFTVNSFVQFGLADFLENEEHYLNLPQFYQQKRDFFTENMNGSRLNPIPSKGTYFQLYDFSEVSAASDVEFAKWLTTEHKVACIPVSVFNSDDKDDHVVRFCFAKKEETLKAAAEILRAI